MFLLKKSLIQLRKQVHKLRVQSLYQFAKRDLQYLFLLM
ncbi:UNVERIFIED_CONTAM: hypothetical protein GTU68_018072 [Idotea baltica]|nr:hypothetical protein [Idotea baltica]